MALPKVKYGDVFEISTANQIDDILIKTRTNGDVIRYNKSTNEFAVTDKLGSIKTYFKPTNGLDYFNAQ